AADVAGGLSAPVFSGFSGIGGVVDAIAPKDAVSRGGFAPAGPDDVGGGFWNGNIAHAEGGLVIGEGGSGIGGVGGFPKATRSGTDVDRFGVGINTLNVDDAAAHRGGADVASGKAVKDGAGTRASSNTGGDQCCRGQQAENPRAIFQRFLHGRE